jgi:hypothetical protein
MICPNCEKEISFWSYIRTTGYSKKCNHCKTEIEPEKKVLFILTNVGIIVVSFIIAYHLRSILGVNNNDWIRDIVTWSIIIILFHISSWFIWKYWKVMPKNNK